MTGRSISHYRILRRLGAGGMGEVYEAEDSDLHRKVALKVLPQDLAAKPETLKRFKREACALTALNIPISSPSSRWNRGIQLISSPWNW
jgi:serine/threonine protein kinase